MSSDQNSDYSVQDSIDAGYELHDVNLLVIIAFAVVCIVVLIVSFVALDGYFVYYKEKLIQEANRYPPQALVELSAQGKNQLTTYATIDKEKGVYRIPVSKAIQILAEDGLDSREESKTK